MSIDMYLSDSLAQATSASHFCQKQVTDYQNLQQAITQFTLQTPNLQGKTYDAAKAYFSQILYPLVQGGILLSEAVEKAAKRFPQEYINQVDSISLKQSELEAQIRQMNQYITQAEGIRQLLLSPHMPEEHQGFQLNQNTLLLTMYHDLKHKLEEKLQKLLAYNQSTAQFFTEIKSLEQAVNQGLAQTKTAWNSQTKTFSMPKDLSWTTTIQDKWQQADNEKKGIDPTKNKELEKYNVYALIIHDSEGNPRVFWKIEDKQSGYGIVNPELYQYVTKVGHYLDPELIQFMTYDTYQEKVNAAWRQGINYETGEKLDPLLGSLVSTSQYVKDGYTWINESELGQALMVLGFTYASYKVLTTTGVKQVESGKIEDVTGNLSMSDSGIAQSRINIANGQTRFTPVRKSGERVSAGFDHVIEGHFDRPLANSRSIFSTSPDNLKKILKSPNSIKSSVLKIPGGQYKRIVNTGEIIGHTAVKYGGHPTSWIAIYTDKAGNLITTYPIPKP
ncbi:transposase [Enterococcus mundtii]|uniref:transposase n=1 Tax=Enterococcus mundtii TaxID=53346 RepID=UPI000CF12130|nr:transposase [Enterococcus mundtii]PQC30462.1 transposase [Enterococcus mundtii]